MALQTLEANVGIRSNSPFGPTESGLLRVRGTLSPAICKSIDALFNWEIKSIGGHPTDTPYKSIGWDETPIEKELHLLCLPVEHIPPPEHEPGRQLQTIRGDSSSSSDPIHRCNSNLCMTAPETGLQDRTEQRLIDGGYAPNSYERLPPTTFKMSNTPPPPPPNECRQLLIEPTDGISNSTIYTSVPHHNICQPGQ